MLSIIALVISILSLIASIEMYRLKRLEQRKRILLEMLVDNMLDCLKCLDEEYVIKAIENNYSELGFTEHAMFSDIYNEYGMRPPYSDLEEYIETINSLKEKYREKIKIYIGMECEYFKEYHDELKELLDSKKMDYLIFGNHYVAHKKDFASLFNS